MIEVKFGRPSRGISAAWVGRVVRATLAFEKQKGRLVSVFLTDDREIRKINKRYLDHNTATDVISFWFEDGPLTEKGSGCLGDLVVSVETAGRVAKEMAIPFKEELARYLVHGTLHLLGYNDKAPKDKKVMHRRQEWILDQLCTRAER